MTEAERNYIRDSLGESFRESLESVEHPNGTKIWKLIIGMPYKEWKSILDHVLARELGEIK